MKRKKRKRRKGGREAKDKKEGEKWISKSKGNKKKKRNMEAYLNSIETETILKKEDNGV
jgi:hypothetical protein